MVQSSDVMEKQELIDKLFSVGAHFGYSTTRRHPTAAPYIFGIKGGSELINLEQTSELLIKALSYIESLAAQRKTILFVGSKAEARDIVSRAALRIAQPYVASRWIGGTLTNFSEIKKRINRLTEHSALEEKGELAKFTKHERLLIEREITDLETMFGGLRGMNKLPDAMVVVDPRHESIAVTEAKLLSIPLIAILNTDCDASKIQYPVPANDASTQSLTFILGEMASMYEKNLGVQAPAGSAAESSN